MKVKVDLKICGVCGDKALGYNFNAVTCESCKAFFRRNALIEKNFKCPFNNQCEITTVTRRFCQKCRLDKCFNIGMCKDLIMTEQDKVLKRQKVEENRAKKRSMGSFKSGFKKIKRETDCDLQDNEFLSSSVCTDSDSKDTNISDGYQPNNPNIVSVINYINGESSRISSEENMDNINDRLVSSSDDFSTFKNVLEPQRNISEDYESSLLTNLSNNNNINSNSLSQESPHPEVRETLEITNEVDSDIQRENRTPPNSIESILSEAIKLEYEAYSSIGQCNLNSRELNDAERAKLNELIVANKALLSPFDDELNTVLGDECKCKALLQGSTGSTQKMFERDPALVDVVNLTALVIRRLIKMAKKINAFKNMCQEDQVALLKGGCTEIMVLRSAMNYDPTKQTWMIPHSQETFNLNVEVLKLAKGNVYQEHEKFINTFDPKWRSDENIILILCAIVLFTPDRSRVVHQDVIKLEQNSYYYLLRRYLESIYVGCEAKSTFLKLIQKIAELHKLNEQLINVYLDVNPSEIEPLLIEIFDLK